MKKKLLLPIIAVFAMANLINCGNNLPPDEDYDSDGLINRIDPNPRNNEYQVRLDLGEDGQSSDMNIKIDYHDFIADGYNKNLSLLSSFLINAADGSNPIFVNNVYQPSLSEILPIFSQIGCQDITYREPVLDNNLEDPYDMAGIFLGHHIFNDKDTKYQIFFGAINGYPSRKGWISNFDVGAYKNNKITDGYKEFWGTDSHTKWTHHTIHKGFDVTANRLIDIINKYIGEHEINDAQKILIFTGHSRAGALANLVAKDYVDHEYDARAYSFNPPAVTRDSQGDAEDSKYHNIFTFTNTNDIVSRVPCPKYWKFTRYGKPIVIDVEQQGKDLFKNLFGYKYSGCTTNFLNIIEKMLADQSCLVEPDELSDYDSNNLYEKWHYSNPLGIYDNETFDSIDSANAFVHFINEHLSTSVEVTGPTRISDSEYYCSWQSKGAVIVNFLVDLIDGDIEDYLQYYLILLNRVIMETIAELTLEEEISLDIPAQIINAHQQKIACVLAMCANDML